MSLTIDWSIRFGDLIVLAGFITGAVTMIFRGGRLYAALEIMRSEIKNLKELAAQMTAVMQTIAVQKNELEHIRADVDDLKHGRGYVHK